MGPLAVVVVDDSATQRRYLREVLDGDDMFTVVGEAGTADDAVSLVERLQPGAVVMDIDLPLRNGIEAIERIMARRPTPIVVYSACVAGGRNGAASAALAAGAVDVLAKPDGGEQQVGGTAEILRRRLRVAGRAPVITHPRGRLRVAPLVGASVHRSGPVPRVLAIGASTGGPPALATMLAALPPDFDAAVVVVQHMADGFIEGLAGWLDDLCPLPVVVGTNGHHLRAGTVTVAPSGRNLLVHDSLRVSTAPPPPTQYHVPGIDPTYFSIARAMGPAAVGVLLTGMGRDGAAGLAAIRAAGGRTIAQDEATSAVYGMPAAAVTLDAAELQLPLPEIAPAVLDLLNCRAAVPVAREAR